ncbi:glycoside hydrolase superfamily [Obelidium mucronatum]|nr:glycoside hydrolase superfamily [Obelidium mucronatum]
MSAAWWKPTIGTTWQWQLTGKLDTTVPVAAYDVDIAGGGATVGAVLANNPERKVICYVNVGSLEKDGSRADQNQFSLSDVGNAYPGWPNEYFVDIRSANVRRIMQNRFQAMQAAGCHAIEPDNMAVSYKGNSGFSPEISVGDQVDYLYWITGTVHGLGMAVGAKNGGNILGKYPAFFRIFDFAVIEECAAKNDCGQYDPFIQVGRPVFAADYTTSGSGGCAPIKGTVQAACDVLNGHNFEGIIKSCNLNAALTQCRTSGSGPLPDPAVIPDAVIDISTTAAMDVSMSLPNQNIELKPSSTAMHQTQTQLPEFVADGTKSSSSERIPFSLSLLIICIFTNLK